MGLLDHLWDDTLAGPRPETGLGKLRKHNTFSFRSANSGKESDSTGDTRSYVNDSPEEAMRVTRSIMIVKPPGHSSASPPVSPAGSTPPVSPFSAGSHSDFEEDLRRTRMRRKALDQKAPLLLRSSDI